MKNRSIYNLSIKKIDIEQHYINNIYFLQSDNSGIHR